MSAPFRDPRVASRDELAAAIAAAEAELAGLALEAERLLVVAPVRSRGVSRRFAVLAGTVIGFVITAAWFFGYFLPNFHIFG